MSSTPSERSLQARHAAQVGWAHCLDRTARTEKARRGFDERFEREVDPDRVLDPVERARRAESARRAFFSKLALKSAVARRKASEAAARAQVADRELAEATEQLGDELAGDLVDAAGESDAATTVTEKDGGDAR